MKKLFCLSVTLLLTALCAVSAWAAEITYNGIKYTTSGTNATVGLNPNATGDVVIPATFTYSGTTYTVIAIGDQAFVGERSASGEFIPCPITSVVIPNSVKTIGEYAFADCLNLTSVTLSAGLEEIGDFAFVTCAFTSINLPNTLEKIGCGAFRNSLLKSINLPSSLTEIGYNAFYGSALESVVIPGSVKTIPDGAFSECSRLKSITIESGVETIQKNAISGSFASIEIPATVKYLGEISSSTVTEIILHEGLETLGQLYCSNLKSLEIPSTVREILESAFSSTAIPSISLPEGIKKVNSIFGPAQKYVSLPSTIESMYEIAFNFNDDDTHFVYLNATAVPSFGARQDRGSTGAFDRVSNTYLVVPDEALADYQADTHYSTFKGVAARSDASIYPHRLILNDVEALAGNEVALELKAQSNIYGFQVDVKLPKDLSFVKDTNGNAEVALSTANVSMFVISTQFLTSDSLRIVCVPKGTSASYLNANLCTIKVKGNKSGKFQTELHEVVINGGIGQVVQQIKWLDSGSVTYAEFTEGDTNADDYVNVGDLAAVASYLSGSTPDPFVAPAAFFGRDEVTAAAFDDIVDAIGNSNELVASGQTQKGSYTFTKSNSDSSESCYLNLTQGDSFTAYLYFNTAGLDITAIQFDVSWTSDKPASIRTQFDYSSAYVKSCELSNPYQTSRYYFVATDGASTLPGANSYALAFAFDFENVEGLGTQELSLSNVLLSTANGVVYEVRSSGYFYFTVSPPCRKGDPNNDGYINVGDYAAVAYYIANNNSAEGLPAFVEQAADVNEDTQINASDCSAIVTMILDGERPMGAAARDENVESASLFIEASDEAIAGQDIDLKVMIINPTCQFSTFQFDINLPEGMSVVTDDEGYLLASVSTERTTERASDYFVSNMVTDDCLRVFCFSTQNKLFAGNEGEVAIIPLHIDEAVAPGSYILPISQVSLTATGEPLPIQASLFNLEVMGGVPTAIETLGQEDNSPVRYNLQGLRIDQAKSGHIYIEQGSKKMTR